MSDDYGKLSALENLVNSDLQKKSDEVSTEQRKNNFLNQELQNNNALISSLSNSRKSQSKDFYDVVDMLDSAREELSSYKKKFKDLEEKSEWKIKAYEVLRKEMFVLIAEWKISQKTYKRLYDLNAQELGLSTTEMNKKFEEVKTIIEKEEVELVKLIQRWGKSVEEETVEEEPKEEAIEKITNEKKEVGK